MSCEPKRASEAIRRILVNQPQRKPMHLSIWGRAYHLRKDMPMMGGVYNLFDVNPIHVASYNQTSLLKGCRYDLGPDTNFNLQAELSGTSITEHPGCHTSKSGVICFRVGKISAGFSEHHSVYVFFWDRDGEPLILPKDKILWPAETFIEWHRTQVFKS